MLSAITHVRHTAIHMWIGVMDGCCHSVHTPDMDGARASKFTSCVRELGFATVRSPSSRVISLMGSPKSARKMKR